MSASNRAAQTECTHRIVVKAKLLELLRLINPGDQIEFERMSYEQLVTYARDWLDTEIEAAEVKTSQPSSLSLED